MPQHVDVVAVVVARPPAAVSASSSVQRPEKASGPGLFTAPMTEIGLERNSRSWISTEARWTYFDSSMSLSRVANSAAVKPAACTSPINGRRGAGLGHPALDVELGNLEYLDLDEVLGADAVTGDGGRLGRRRGTPIRMARRSERRLRDNCIRQF